MIAARPTRRIQDPNGPEPVAATRPRRSRGEGYSQLLQRRRHNPVINHTRRAARAVAPRAAASKRVNVRRVKAGMLHPDLQEAIAFHRAIVAESSKALVGYDTAKTLANVVLLSEIPTTYDKQADRQVNAGNLLLRGVPGVGKTFFGVILAAISDAKFARLQGRADLQPTEVVGFQMINPATGELVTEFGPLASAEVILLDEINRIPLKSQSAFLEGLQDRTVTVGKTTYELPAFSFAIATMNPVELGQGTFPLSEAATDRFAIIVNIGYLPPEEEQKLVNFDFKQVRLNTLMSKDRIIQLRSAIRAKCFCTTSWGSTSGASSGPRARTTSRQTGCTDRRPKWWSSTSTSAPR